MACQTGGTVSYPKMEVPGRKVFNPRRACVTRVAVVVLCVCVSVFSILPSRAFIGMQQEVSAATAWEMQ